jgi:hypothetical protein
MTLRSAIETLNISVQNQAGGDGWRSLDDYRGPDRGGSPIVGLRLDHVPSRAANPSAGARPSAFATIVVRRADLAEISSPDSPGERLIVCRNRELARERARQTRGVSASHRTEQDTDRSHKARDARHQRGDPRPSVAVAHRD